MYWMQTRHTFMLAAAALLAACADEGGPRAPYVAPPGTLNTAAQPEKASTAAAGTPRARLGKLDAQGNEENEAGVRGLSFDEFQKCMELKASIKQAGTDLGVASKSLEDQKSRIDAEDKAMDEARGRINPGEESAVFAYNSRVKKQQSAVRSYNERVHSYNADVATAKTQGQAFTLNCAERPFRTTDIDRLPESLREIAKNGTEKFDLPVYFSDDPPAKSNPSAADLDPHY